MNDTVMWQRLDPELVEPLKGLLEATGGGLDFNDIAATRTMLDSLIEAIAAEAPPIEGVTTDDRRIAVGGGAPDVAIRIYRPTKPAGPLPATLWLHGGGWALGGIALDDLMCRQFAKDTHCVVVAIEYRLAPEHPFPAAHDDCFATLEWLQANAAELDLDAARIGVAGASAGANLAAGVALRARDEGAPAIAFQMLLYPALDDRNRQPADAAHPDTLFWTRENNRLAWDAYLAGAADISPYAAPARATDVSGLPPAYIAVGSLDLFVDDNADYACRLAAAGVPIEFHVYPGAFHAFDVFAPDAAVSQRFVNDRNTALVRALGA